MSQTGFDELIEALTIFRKHANPQFPFHCEHDTLTVCVSPSAVPSEDRARLAGMGFDANEREDCFQSYRYGSA